MASPEPIHLTLEEHTLTGTHYAPSQSKGTVLFLEGFGGSVDDYEPFLSEVGATYDVFALNYQGHATSTGAFTLPGAIQDAINTFDTLGIESPHLIGHSIGCNIGLALAQERNIQTVSMIEPYLALSHIPLYLQAAFRLGAQIGKTRVGKYIDTKLTHSITGAHVRNPLHALQAPVDAKDAYTTHVPASYALAKNSELFRDSTRLQLVASNISPTTEDLSATVLGLNHCLNTQFMDLAPFFKEEPGKDRTPFFDALFAFMERHEK